MFGVLTHVWICSALVDPNLVPKFHRKFQMSIELSPSLFAELCVHMAIFAKKTRIETRAEVYEIRGTKIVSRWQVKIELLISPVISFTQHIITGWGTRDTIQYTNNMNIFMKVVMRVPNKMDSKSCIKLWHFLECIELGPRGTWWARWATSWLSLSAWRSTSSPWSDSCSSQGQNSLDKKSISEF